MNVLMLSVVILNVVMLSVVAPLEALADKTSLNRFIISRNEDPSKSDDDDDGQSSLAGDEFR